MSPFRCASANALHALLLGTLLFSSGCTFFKYGTCQPFGGGEAKIVPVSMYDRGAANPTNRLFAWCYYDAKYRASHTVTDKDGNPMILSEAPPDVAESIERLLALSVKYKDIGLGASNYLHTAITQLASRTAAVELMRDGGYAIRELAFNNRLQGGITNIVVNGSITNVTIMPNEAGQRLQQLFSTIEAVANSPQAEQTERARAVALYLQCCANATNTPPDTNVIHLLQCGGQISNLTATNMTKPH